MTDPPDHFGDYERLALIGRGGMGKVFRARHRRTGIEVALKILDNEALADPELRRRFLVEIDIVKRLDHPHIVKVIDFGTGSQPYIVMSLLRGQNLAEMLKGHGPLPLGVAAGIVRDVASALAAAHHAQLRHRDIKPHNIMIIDKGGNAYHPMVIDWGIGQIISAQNAAPLTRTDAIIGTPAYIAPERLSRSQTPDGRADVYSLAIVLYECLVGRPPYEGELMAVLAGHVDPKPPPLPDSIPGPMRSVLRKGLAPDPNDRYLTAEAFGAAVEHAARSGDGPRNLPRTAVWAAVGACGGALLTLAATTALGVADWWVVGALVVPAGGLLGYGSAPRPAAEPAVNAQPTIDVGRGGLPSRRR